ncbi:MFS transporter [Hyphomonas sp.]|uniref:MFS transporter n=1 Tax=Hyphomonas sp. TaxID=87 RepID=UPI003F711C83
MSATRKVTFWAVLALASPSMISQFISAPFIGIVPGLYAKYLGMPLAALSVIILVSRVFDAITDPAVGLLSDHYKKRWNTRKPWLVIGFLTAALASWFISSPSDGTSIIYFATWSLVFYLGWTMIEVPHNAWASEVTQDYNQRTTVFFVKTMFAVLGALGFALVPLLPMFATTEFTFETMKVTAVIFFCLGSVCVMSAVFFAPDGRQPAPRARGVMMGRSYIRSMLSNGPFLRFLIAFLIAGLAAGMNGTLQFIYLDVYLGLGKNVAAILGTGVFLGLFGIGVWYLVMLRMQKHRAWSLSLGLGAFWILAPATLSPGEAAFIPYTIMFAGMVLSVGAGLIAPYTLLADIVDYDRWRSGEDRAGSYFSIFLFAVKINTALGGAVAFFMLGISGFDAAATAQSVSGGWGIRLAFSIVPGILYLVACAVMWNYPLSRERHQEIVSELS